MLNTITTIALVLQAISSVLLILVIMFQSGKSSGLGSTISGNSASYFSKGGNRTLDAKLASATKWFAAAFVVLTIIVLVLNRLAG